jgi:hypothetical protein
MCLNSLIKSKIKLLAFTSTKLNRDKMAATKTKTVNKSLEGGCGGCEKQGGIATSVEDGDIGLPPLKMGTLDLVS